MVYKIINNKKREEEKKKKVKMLYNLNQNFFHCEYNNKSITYDIDQFKFKKYFKNINKLKKKLIFIIRYINFK